MGSRIMHLIIADQIANKVLIHDRNSFLLGGIAPDAVSPKDLSHFFSGNANDFTRGIDYEGFLEKYKDFNQHNYILGYYIHLIADDLWLRGFYLPWLKNRMENDENIFNLYHNDFHLLNGKLIDFYNISTEMLSGLDKNGSIMDLEEVNSIDVKEFIPYVLEDMNYDQNVIEQTLNVFTFEQIIGYIETSIEKGIFYIKPLLETKKIK